MRATLEESIWLGFTLIRLTWTPSVVSSRAPRLERPMPQGASAPLPRSPEARAPPDEPTAPCSHHGLAFAKPAAPCLLAQSRGKDPLLTLPRDGEGDPRVQGVFHPEEHLRPGRLRPETQAKTVTG